MEFQVSSETRMIKITVLKQNEGPDGDLKPGHTYSKHKQDNDGSNHCKKGKTKVQGVAQSQAAALPRHQEEKKTDETKQTQIERRYKKFDPRRRQHSFVEIDHEIFSTVILSLPLIQ